MTRPKQPLQELEFASVFVSYGGPDEAFALALSDAFEARGVQHYIFARDAEPGQPLHALMRQAVTAHDRVLLVCSKRSLDRTGVLNEIEEALRREAREGGNAILIPLTIDDYVFDDWAPADPGHAQAIRDRAILHFRDVAPGSPEFGIAFERLMSVLRYD